MPPRTRMSKHGIVQTPQNENERDFSTLSNLPRGSDHAKGRGRGCGGKSATHDVLDCVKPMEQLR